MSRLCLAGPLACLCKGSRETVNIYAGYAQALALLDELTYGKDAPAEVRAMRDWWFAQKAAP